MRRCKIETDQEDHAIAYTLLSFQLAFQSHSESISLGCEEVSDAKGSGAAVVGLMVDYCSGKMG